MVEVALALVSVDVGLEEGSVSYGLCVLGHHCRLNVVSLQPSFPIGNTKCALVNKDMTPFTMEIIV